MKRIIQFDKAFKFSGPVSAILVIASLAAVLLLGVNSGIDFQSGVNIRLQFGEPALSIAYKGEGELSFTARSNEFEFIQRLAADNRRFSFAIEGKTISQIKAEIESVAELAGIEVGVIVPDSTPASRLIPPSDSNKAIGLTPFKIFMASAATSGRVSVEGIRSALAADFGNVLIQSIGDAEAGEYQIRVQEFKGDDDGLAKADEVRKVLESKLAERYGAESFVVRSTDAMDSRFSKSLVENVIWLTLVTFVLIMVYATIRFKLDFAVAAIVAVIHDALIVVGFIALSRMEFNTSSIAAILTIVGYSINDTIVIFDRVREKIKQNPEKGFGEVANMAITETLSRTFITSGTTLLAVVAIGLFTTGSMRDFAILMFIGIAVGTYSSVFVATAFVKMLRGAAAKRAERAKHAHLNAKQDLLPR
jgi:preprotein translocase subunit SecF